MIYNILKNRNMSKKEEKKDKKVFYIEEKIKTNIFYNIFVALNEFEINMKLYQFYNTKLNKYNFLFTKLIILLVIYFKLKFVDIILSSVSISSLLFLR